MSYGVSIVRIWGENLLRYKCTALCFGGKLQWYYKESTITSTSNGGLYHIKGEMSWGILWVAIIWNKDIIVCPESPLKHTRKIIIIWLGHYIYVYMYICRCFYMYIYMFLSINFAFRITDWTCCHGPHLHAILRIISRVFSGLATDSPCSVWGRGWTTCLLHDSPLFGSHFKMRVGM